MSSFFDMALREAYQAYEQGEVPVGAVLVKEGRMIAKAHNQTRLLQDPTAHAEILAIRAACKELKNERLKGCDIYVTLEPCAMCAAALSFARIRRIYYAAPDPKGGGIDHGPRLYTTPTCHHAPEVYGHIREEEAAKILRDFFQNKR